MSRHSESLVGIVLRIHILYAYCYHDLDETARQRIENMYSEAVLRDEGKTNAVARSRSKGNAIQRLRDRRLHVQGRRTSKSEGYPAALPEPEAE